MRRDSSMEEPMTDIKHGLTSANKYSEDVIDQDCSTGAIVGSREETILFASSPLSELVWSQREGPTLKYTASSSAEKKASHFWYTESVSMLFPSPEYTDHEETANTRDVATQTLSSLQQKPNFEINDPKRITLLGSPLRTPEMQPSSSLRPRETNQGTSKSKELLNRKGKAVLDNEEEYNQSLQKVGIYPRNDRILLNILKPGENKPGPDNCDASPESLPYNLKEIRGDQSRAEDPYTSHIEAATDFFRGTGCRVSILKEREDSYEIAESTNSKSPTSMGKRAPSSNSTSEASIKLKRQRNENSSSGSFVKHERSPSSSPESKKKSKGLNNSCSSAGFKSFFKAMYQSNFKGQKSCNDFSEHRAVSEQHFNVSFPAVCDEVQLAPCKVFPSVRDCHKLHNGILMSTERYQSNFKWQKSCNDSSEHRAVSEQHFHVSFPTVCDEVQLAPCKVFPSAKDCHKLHNGILMSTERRNQGTCQVEVLSPTNVNKQIALYQNTKGNIGKDCSPVVMGSPSCFTKIVSESPENKRFGLSASIPSTSPDMLTNKSSFLENLWIRRLLPQSSSFRKIIPQCNQRVETAYGKLTNNCSMLNPHVTYSNKEQCISRDCQIPSLEGPRVTGKGAVKNTSISLLDPCDSERKNDQKFKFNLNPILPSQWFEKSEHMASVFAKKLGAFRHIRPSTVSCNATCPASQCYFCHKTDHSIQKELELTELEDILKNMNSYNVPVESSSLCIRCFQLSHCASRCPHASFQKKHITNTASLVGDHRWNKIDSTIGNSSSNYDGRYVLQTGGEQERHQECQMYQKRIGMVSPHVTNGMGNVEGPCVNNICLNPAKRLKPSSSRTQVNEPKENQTIPNCHIDAIKGTDYRSAIFERMRMLRLSRTDIIRWMMSPISHFSLEGFFLRLRLAKWEAGLGRTGYHVACISGVNCKGYLSASIGGFTSLVDSHSISNHDFAEEELMAWWSAALKGSGKIPTIEELDKRLKDRMEFGF